MIYEWVSPRARNESSLAVRRALECGAVLAPAFRESVPMKNGRIRNALLGSIALLATAAGFGKPAAAQQQAPKPNILIIWGDDIGVFNLIPAA